MKEKSKVLDNIVTNIVGEEELVIPKKRDVNMDRLRR